MSDKLTRRDFLKLTAIGAGAVGLTAVGVEAVTNPHFENGLKVAKELIKAEISRDPERIIESRKLAMVWLFAETAAKYGKEMGFEAAGFGMDHFLYGNGTPLDISPLLEKVVMTEPERFVGNLISAAVNDTEEDTSRKITTKKDYQFTNRALKELTSATGLKTVLDARQWFGGWEDLYYAFGGAKYILHAPEATIVSQDRYGEYVVLEKGVDIAATDRYYWRLDFEMGLDSKSSVVAGDVAEKMFDQFYKSHDFVEKTIRGLDLPDEQVTRIMNIYSGQNKDQFVQGLASGAYKLVEGVDQSLIGKPDLAENDLNLLKKLGAMDYDMGGHVNILNRLEIIV